MVYSKIPADQMTLRDHLARDRTILANERTLLAYLRTGFGLAAGGGTLVKLFPEDAALRWTGVALVVCAAIVTVIGIARFFTVNARMRKIAS